MVTNAVFFVDPLETTTMAAPVAYRVIDTSNPTQADIIDVLQRTAGAVSSASYFFVDAAGGNIDQTVVLRTLKDMFAGQGPADDNGVPRTLQWRTCLESESVANALRAIGVVEPAVTHLR